jgi:hypothetical protein
MPGSRSPNGDGVGDGVGDGGSLLATALAAVVPAGAAMFMPDIESLLCGADFGADWVVADEQATKMLMVATAAVKAYTAAMGRRGRLDRLGWLRVMAGAMY